MAVPKLRFPGFEGEWKEHKLGGIAEIKDSARISNEFWVEKGVPYLRSSDLVNNELQGELFISKETYNKYSLQTGSPQKGDVLFTSGGKVGVTHHKEDDSDVYVQGGAILYVKTSTSEILNGSFLNIYFSTHKMRKYMENASVGGTIKHFTLIPANATPIIYPSIKEQQKIGSLFKVLDKKIQLQQEKIDLLKEQKKGFMQKIFKIPSNSTTNIYYLSQLGNFYKGHTLAKQDLSDDGLPCVLYGHLYTEYNEVISSVKYKTANTSGFPGIKGDLLIPSSGETVIDIARTAALQEDALLGGDLTILRVDSQIVDSVYLSYLINAKYKFTLAKFAQGASVVHLYSSEIKKLAVELPTIEQQYKVGSVLLKIDKKILLEESKKHALLIQKQAFLQQMFI